MPWFFLPFSSYCLHEHRWGACVVNQVPMLTCSYWSTYGSGKWDITIEVLCCIFFARLHLKASVTVFTNFCWISRPQKFCHISIHDIHWHSRNDLFSFLLPMNCNILSWCLRLEVCLLILLLICNCYFRQVNQDHSADHQPHDGL